MHPSVAGTANAFRMPFESYLRHRGALFLQKPLRPDVLAARVREVLDGAAIPRQEQAANCVQSGM